MELTFPPRIFNESFRIIKMNYIPSSDVTIIESTDTFFESFWFFFENQIFRKIWSHFESGYTLSSKYLSSFALEARRTTGMSVLVWGSSPCCLDDGKASGGSASFRHAVSNWIVHTWNWSIIFTIVHARGQHLEFISYVFLQVAQINGVAAVIVLILDANNFPKSVPLCGRSRMIWGSFCRKCGSGLSLAMMRTHSSLSSFSFVGAPGTTRRNCRSRRHRLAHVHGSEHTVECSRNRVQWERVIRKPGHHTFNSVFRETSQVQCLPASNIWERSDNVQYQHGSICPAVHWIARATWRLVRLSFLPESRLGKKGVKKLIFAGRKLFHQGRHLQHTHDIIETGNVPALISGRNRTIARGWVKLISIHGHARHSRGTWQSRDKSRSQAVRHTQVFAQVATLESHHGMIPTSLPLWMYRSAWWHSWCSLDIADINHDETCCFDSQNHVAETRSRALSRCDMTACGMRASTNQGTDKKGEIAHAHWKQDTGKQQCLSQRRKHCLAETDRHCLSWRRENQTQRTGMPSNWLATHWTHFTQDTNGATCVATSQRLAVTTGQLVTTWLSNVFKIERACSSHAIAWPDASDEKQKQVSVETYQITCWVQLAKLTHCDWRLERDHGDIRKHDTQFRVVQTRWPEFKTGK